MDERARRLTPEELTVMVAQAKELEARRPKWIVLAGSYSAQFVAYYRPAPGGYLIADSLPGMETAMRDAEDRHAAHAADTCRRSA